MSSEREVEAKYRLPDPAALRLALAGAGAALQAHEAEENTILDTPEARLRGLGAALRVRVARPLGGGVPVSRLTYKGPKDPGELAGGIRAREELELEVRSDGPALLRLLARLGFHPQLAYEKRRETWRFGDCLVTLDELPRLGWFAEIEAPDAAAVRRCQAALAIDAATAVPETYVELTARHGRPQPDGTSALRFE